MPVMKLNTTRKLAYDQKKELADSLGQAITLIPGKPAEGLLLYVEDAKTMFLGGKEQDDYVFIQADYCGHFDFDIRNKFSVAVFTAVERIMGTPKDRISMKINENDGWANFGDYIEVDKDGNPKPR